MTPPEDQHGQFGVPYPGAGQDAFGVPGADSAQRDSRSPQGAHAAHGGGPGEAPPSSIYPDGGSGPNWADAGAAFRTPPRAGESAQLNTAEEYGGWDNDPWGLQTAPVSEPHGEQESLIRPYAMTGGRTKPRYQLAIEALVSTTAHPDRIGGLLPEHQRICDLCMELKSVAEVSALLHMPLGVARILVADLAESGLVAIHQPAAAGADAGGQPDVTLLERVLSGLRKL
ncbi:DUF742 domain-containing protein [Phaeacidiphilus oryzae]|uniref:DUF742 domain-containing protein n=1 Tax=Phaeacidiphilus oryzae TaxID=348818 RepID=UPI000AEC3F09|nr:DUF742 domain-containing protein [Phaeacidiphilus oryzae]